MVVPVQGSAVLVSMLDEGQVFHGRRCDGWRASSARRSGSGSTCRRATT